MTARFGFDTSAIIGAWRRRLPHDVVPTFWKKLDGLIAAGEVRCTEEVRRELEMKDDEVLAWAKERREHFVALTPEQNRAKKSGDVAIPDVCDAYDIPCTDVYGFVRRLGWNF